MGAILFTPLVHFLPFFFSLTGSYSVVNSHIGHAFPPPIVSCPSIDIDIASLIFFSFFSSSPNLILLLIATAASMYELYDTNGWNNPYGQFCAPAGIHLMDFSSL